MLIYGDQTLSMLRKEPYVPQMSEREHYEYIINEALAINTKLQNISNEGIIDFFKTASINLVDLFGRLINTFKSNALNVFRSLKRSELRYYVESNMLMVGIVDNYQFNNTMNIQVPIPSGMTVDYLTAVKALKMAYSDIDILNVGSAMIQQSTDTYVSISRALASDNTTKLTSKPILNTIKTKDMLLKRHIALNTKHFTDKRTGTVFFKNVYKSMEDFRTVKSELLGMEDNLKNVETVVKNLTEIDKVVGNTVDVISGHEDKFTKQYIGELVEMIRIFATTFDAYSIFNKTQMALEHNHIEVINTLHKKLN